MKLIIAGSRNITDEVILFKALKKFNIKSNNVSEVVCGMAKGADALGFNYGSYLSITIKEFKPDWNKFGKSAGHRRNRDMGDYGDVLLALWDGESRGTKGMIEYMKSLGKPTYVYNIKEENE